VSTKQPVVTGDAMLRALKHAGFNVTRVRGSHYFLAHADGRKTTVPVHSGATLKSGTLHGILRDVEMNADDLRHLLGR
jgi:predicted RNA binding protein YcfA (HicA-like mRNA interferase family)